MAESILTSVKKALGITSDYQEFDQDIIMHINSVFSTLNQLGLGPINGFMIYDDSETWDLFLDDDFKLNNTKSYMYLRVRLLFDPPSTSFGIEAIKSQAVELEWRLNVTRENSLAENPTP